MDSRLTFSVKALDAGHGYTLNATMIVDGVRTAIEEHFATEAALRSRLGTGFDIWAAQVDSE